MKDLLTQKAPENFAFVCKNGARVHSIEELRNEIKKMPKEDFSHFVHHTHNHFANWIEDIFELDDLPNALRSVNTKTQTLAILDATLAHKRIETTISEDSATKPDYDKGIETKLESKTKHIHSHISDLHKKLHHMTKYDTHTPKHSAKSYEPITQEVKDKLIDFGFGLIIGLVVGVLIGKSLGAF